MMMICSLDFGPWKIHSVTDCFSLGFEAKHSCNNSLKWSLKV